MNMPQHGAGMLTLFKGITRSAIAIDLYLFTSSYQGFVSLSLITVSECFSIILLLMSIVIFVSFLSLAKPAYQACVLFIL